MKRTLTLFIICAFWFHLSSLSQGETFTNKLVLNQAPSLAIDRYYLQHPFEILYGPDDSLWISQRRGSVIKVNTTTGKRRIILDISSFVKFTTSGSPVTSISQDGMMGMALHPDYPTVDSFYVAYALISPYKVRIARYKVTNSTITTRANETIIMDGIPVNTDHSSGRLIVGPDRKLYYSCGDQGANQFGFACNPNRAQDVPTSSEMTSKIYNAYAGKVLRINLDGSIPSDNATIKGIQTHIYSFGHRNPNGLVFAKNNVQQDYVGAKLYSGENGSATDDEINQIVAGKNYGWPYIAGLQDNKKYQYKNWSSASPCSGSGNNEPECATNTPSGARVMNETDTTLPNFQTPMKTLFTPPGSIACSWLSNPTVAPSSVDFYGWSYKIPGWQNSVLLTTLKEGTIFRFKLNAAGTAFVNMSNGFDTARYFREENRFRDIAIGRDGITFYLVTDSVGQTSGPTGGSTTVLNNHGSILVYKYTGPILEVKENPITTTAADRLYIKLYPNPTAKILFIESKRNVAKPIVYKIYDVTGRLVITGTSTKDNIEVNVEKLLSGVYTVKLYNGHEINILTQKIVVQ